MPIVPPTVTMTTALATGMTTGTIAGDVTDDGGSVVVAKGFIVGTTNPPSGPLNQVGSGIGVFSSLLYSLLAGRTYFVRAYATNALGTTSFSSNTLSFTTTPASPPGVTTYTPSSVTANSFIGGGSVNTDGGAAITERGIVYSTSPNPDIISGVRIPMGAGLGGFSGTVSGLASNQTYYVRAYAINSGNIVGYGNQVSVVTTLAAPSQISPSNNATLPCCNQWFNWTTVSGATSYELQISKSSTFAYALRTLLLCGSGSLSATSVNRAIETTNIFCVGMGTSSNIGYWYWRVRAISGSNVSAWSATRMFYYPY
jgi:hypothetical protein